MKTLFLSNMSKSRRLTSTFFPTTQSDVSTMFIGKKLGIHFLESIREYIAPTKEWKTLIMRAFKHWDPITKKNQILPAFTLSIIEVLLQCEINFSQNCFKVKGIFFSTKGRCRHREKFNIRYVLLWNTLSKLNIKEQGQIHGYRSCMRVGRGHIWGHQIIWAGAVRSKK